MPDIAKTGSCQMRCEDSGGACLITRAPGAVPTCQPGRRDGPAVILTVGPGVLRARLRAGCLARRVPREAAP